MPTLVIFSGAEHIRFARETKLNWTPQGDDPKFVRRTARNPNQTILARSLPDLVRQMNFLASEGRTFDTIIFLMHGSAGEMSFTQGPDGDRIGAGNQAAWSKFLSLRKCVAPSAKVYLLACRVAGEPVGEQFLSQFAPFLLGAGGGTMTACAGKVTVPACGPNYEIHFEGRVVNAVVSPPGTVDLQNAYWFDQQRLRERIGLAKARVETVIYGGSGTLAGRDAKADLRKLQTLLQTYPQSSNGPRPATYLDTVWLRDMEAALTNHQESWRYGHSENLESLEKSGAKHLTLRGLELD